MTRSIAAASLALVAASACAGVSTEPPLAPDALVASSGSRSQASGERGSPGCDWTVDRFDASAAGAFPEGWTTWDEDELEAAKKSGRWRVGGSSAEPYLAVRGGADAWTIGRPVDGWDLERHPILRWRWRLIRLPEAGPSAELEPPSLGVVWLVGLPFIVRRVDYVWNWRHARGERFSSRFGQDQLIVLESAPAAPAWRDASVDVRRHYASLFDSDEPPAPAGIAITAPKATTASFEMQLTEIQLCRSSS